MNHSELFVLVLFVALVFVGYGWLRGKTEALGIGAVIVVLDLIARALGVL